MFQLADDKAIVAINRGWAPLNSEQTLGLRDTRVTTPTGKVVLPLIGFTLGPATTDASAAQIELQYLDLNTIGDTVGHSVEAATVILDKGSKNSLQYNWQPVVMSPQRHYAYALQWFALAATWLIFGIIWQTRRKKPSTRPENQLQ